MSKDTASEIDLFRTSEGLHLAASLKRTLAHCLYWMQHATHENGGMPSIWKTGPELQHELGIAARTANTHLKTLAGRGFWVLTYRPKPGTVGKVSWLTLLPAGASLIQLARDRKAEFGISGRRRKQRGEVIEEAHRMSQSATSRQIHPTQKDAEKTGSFILSGEAKKEAQKTPGRRSTGDRPRPLRYLTVGPNAESFAGLVFDLWKNRKLKTWDWSSRFTWTYIDEIVDDLCAREIVREEAWAVFLGCLLENWSWMRCSLEPRFANHGSNLHAPSPMALAHEFEKIFSMYEDKIKALDNPPTFTSLDEDF